MNKTLYTQNPLAWDMKLVSLISGGIDSPVATHMMLDRGADIMAVHFDNRPFTDDGQFNKTTSLVNHIAKLNKLIIKRPVL